MPYLLDTNVVSELWRRRCDPAVSAWADSVVEDEHHLSVIVIGEIRRGIAGLESRDPVQAQVLDDWLSTVVSSYASRILPIDVNVAERWGRLNARRTLPVIDGLLAATALVHDLTLVTRNVADVAGSGVRVLDPWGHR